MIQSGSRLFVKWSDNTLILFLFTHRTAGAAIGTGIDAFLSEPAKIQAAVAGLVALTAGYYAAKGSLGIGFRFLEARLGKDSSLFTLKSYCHS